MEECQDGAMCSFGICSGVSYEISAHMSRTEEQLDQSLFQMIGVAAVIGAVSFILFGVMLRRGKFPCCSQYKFAFL